MGFFDSIVKTVKNNLDEAMAYERVFSDLTDEFLKYVSNKGSFKQKVAASNLLSKRGYSKNEIDYAQNVGALWNSNDESNFRNQLAHAEYEVKRNS